MNERSHPLLYENKDGFIVESKLGDIDYFVEVLKSCVKKYGLIESPDHNDLLCITKVTNEYNDTEAFVRAMGSPVYPNVSLRFGIMRIEDYLLTFDKKLLKTKEASKQFYESILDMIEEEIERYWDILRSR